MKIFKEEQRFTQWWVIVLFIALNGIFLFGIYKQIILKTPFGDSPMSNSGLIASSIGFLILTIFFFALKLKTRIDESGIYYKFSPIQTNFRKKSWKEIKSVNLIKFNPILDYGGWGIKGNSYTVKGSIGIKIQYKNNTSFLIGTQNKEDVKRVIATYQNKLS